MNKKRLRIIALASLLFLFTIGTASAFSDTIKYFKGEDNRVITVYGLSDHAFEGAVASEVQDDVKVGDIITRNGRLERVFAIHEDGGYITEVIED